MDATNPPSPSSVSNGPPTAEPLAFRRVDMLLIFGFWTLIALLTAANALLDPRGRSLLHRRPVCAGLHLLLSLGPAHAAYFLDGEPLQRWNGATGFRAAAVLRGRHRRGDFCGHQRRLVARECLSHPASQADDRCGASRSRYALLVRERIPGVHRGGCGGVRARLFPALSGAPGRDHSPPGTRGAASGATRRMRGSRRFAPNSILTSCSIPCTRYPRSWSTIRAGYAV